LDFLVRERVEFFEKKIYKKPSKIQKTIQLLLSISSIYSLFSHSFPILFPSGIGILDLLSQKNSNPNTKTFSTKRIE